MSDLHELPDLAGDVRDRVVVPPYDEVSRRVRARQLRGAAGSLAAAVLVVAGLAVWQSTGTTDAPQPAPAPADDAWRSVVAGEMAHPFEVSGTDDGSVAIVWRNLVHPEPTFALVMREADGTVHGTPLDTPVMLTPVPGGWVGTNATHDWLIGTEGTWTPLEIANDYRAQRPGDIVVRDTLGPLLYSPSDRSLAPLRHPRGVPGAGHVTPDGHAVSCLGSDAVDVWRDEDRVVHETDLPGRGFGCVLAGQGDRVVVAGLGDRTNGTLPPVTLLRSEDGGVTWTRLPFKKITSLTSLAMTTDGTTVVTGDDGDSIVLRGGTLSEPDVELGLAFAGGDRLYALSYGQSKSPLLYSDDDGRTWEKTVLPGMESIQE